MKRVLVIIILVAQVNIANSLTAKSPASSSTTAIDIGAVQDVAQEETPGMLDGIGFYVVLILFFAAGGAALALNSKLKSEKAVVHDQHLKLTGQNQVIQKKEKELQTRSAQAKQLYEKLQLAAKQQAQMKTKFETAYGALMQKQKEQESRLSKELETRSELESANSKLEEAQVRLVQAEKMSSLGKLTAGIAHEINNPVNFVANGVNTLKDDFDRLNVFIDNYKRICELDSIEEVKKYYKIMREDDADYEDVKTSTSEALDDIEYGTTRITEIVNGLRVFSRQDEVEIKEAQINEILEKALLILKPKYKKKAKVLKNFDSNIPKINCLPGQINQAMVNIIGNAADAIDFKGTISIKTRELDEDNIQVMIIDDGKGMPEDVVSQIFDPFFTTKDVGKGTGLGLAITFGIIEKHDGRIEVDSTEGKGTTFTITLPKKLKRVKKTFNEHIT